MKWNIKVEWIVDFWKNTDFLPKHFKHVKSSHYKLNEIDFLLCRNIFCVKKMCSQLSQKCILLQKQVQNIKHQEHLLDHLLSRVDFDIQKVPPDSITLLSVQYNHLLMLRFSACYHTLSSLCWPDNSKVQTKFGTFHSHTE